MASKYNQTLILRCWRCEETIKPWKKGTDNGAIDDNHHLYCSELCYILANTTPATRLTYEQQLKKYGEQKNI